MMHDSFSRLQVIFQQPARALTRFLLPGLASALMILAACRPDHPELREADLEYYVETLSADGYRGRESGSAYGRAAAGFLAQRYQSGGLAPAFPVRESGRFRFFQEFEFQGGVVAEPGSYLEIGIENPDPDAEARSEKIEEVVPLPLGYAGEARGDLIFLGFCVNGPGWDDFAGHETEIKGKIALCLRYGPGGKDNPKYRQQISFRSKYAELVKREAAGVIFLGLAGAPAPEPSDLGAVSGRRVPAVFVEPGPLRARFDFLSSVMEQTHETASDASLQLYRATLGRVLAPARMGTRLRESTLKGYNVGAYLRPPRAEERVIVVGAHYDHIGLGAFSSIRGKGAIHNGADDNASGTAVVLELAQYLRALDAGKGIPERDPGALTPVPDSVNVLFLNFDAEERGLFGSREFMRSRVLPSERIVAMINLDMVGRLRIDKGLSVQGARSADERWKRIIEEAFAQTGFPDELELRLVRGGSGPSDHSAFYTEKIPVAFLFTGGHREYHTPEDDAHLVNIRGLRQVTEMTGRLVLGLARLEDEASRSGASAPLAYRRAPDEATRSDFEFRVRLGIVPGDYSRGGSGLEVGDVKDDAPVKRTGLRAGDIIVRLGDREIRDIHDYMEFLGNASARKDYAIEFKRGDRVIRSQTRLIAAP